MQPHEQRVVDEQKELQIKLDALNTFLCKGCPAFINKQNWELLERQYNTMWLYNDILKQRIRLFE
ncbi:MULTISPECIES: crAss001_48 related protein [Acinetobacter calcoaceticus/baumannii complex]|uniref:crAss001_48 related protein n=1 Tax=Acinetobacter calcoaceticus/baumannii complex TaxID=909768 RepID=UPI0015806484|nr:hypothetical protein [Acinetobacter seifertii]NUG10171.1 hypothetical protein [Acinetobacter seifertii]